MVAAVSAPAFRVGDLVTVRATDQDPIEISTHRHAEVTAVEGVSGHGTFTYMVGHPRMSERRYGPYGPEKLIRGWNTP